MNATHQVEIMDNFILVLMRIRPSEISQMDPAEKSALNSKLLELTGHLNKFKSAYPASFCNSLRGKAAMLRDHIERSTRK